MESRDLDQEQREKLSKMHEQGSSDLVDALYNSAVRNSAERESGKHKQSELENFEKTAEHRNSSDLMKILQENPNKWSTEEINGSLTRGIETIPPEVILDEMIEGKRKFNAYEAAKNIN